MNNILEMYKEQFSQCENIVDTIHTLNNLSEEIERLNPKHSLELSKEAYNLSIKEGYERGLARSLFRIGRSHWLLGDLEMALSSLLQALEISKKLNIPSYEVETLNTLGNVNIKLQIYDRGLEYYMEALKLAKHIKYTTLEAGLLNNIGEIYKEFKDYTTALDYYLKSKKLCEDLKDENSISIPLLNIASIYYFSKEHKLAEKYTNESLKICKENNDKIGECYSLHQLGKIYFKQELYEKALNFFEASLSIAQNVSDRLIQIEIYIDFHELMTILGNMELALRYLNSALSLAEEINTKSLMAKVYSYLAKLYEHMENYEKTLFYYKKFHNAEKEANSFELEQKLRSITTQFKVEQSQQEKEIYRLINIDLKQKTKELEQSSKELQEAYDNIKIISDIGQSITSTLNLEKILIRVYENINHLMDASVFGIGLTNETKQIIEYKLYMEDSVRAPIFSTSLESTSSWAVWCLKNRKEIMINDVENQYANYIQGRKNSVGGRMESIIYYPLIVEDTILGVLTVQSKRKNAYSQYNFDMVRALSSYIAIAINNAQESEKLAEEIKVRKNAQMELEKINEKLLRLSEIDGLTGIPNRRRFDEFFSLEWSKSEEYSNYLSLLIVDIDCFKEYNDHYGHLAGDEVIRKIATLLQNSLKRCTDFVARYGGDEFIVVLPSTNAEGALCVAKRMKKAIESLKIEHNYSSVEKYITITIGVSSIIPKNNIDKETLIHTSDKALYEAKGKGRNAIEFLG
ncbi:diguanylate cyclase domain-containing protein [Desnuesiella massiliensis]|uniref:diguanylate cyclase domain-containing protein n=1 Tax=Desnuesiella massiliensis TaxID=1650662 RepID=UPI0006E22B4F|nr:diguanylate cyclase [Desnuesiella massiliensis]